MREIYRAAALGLSRPHYSQPSVLLSHRSLLYIGLKHAVETFMELEKIWSWKKQESWQWHKKERRNHSSRNPREIPARSSRDDGSAKVFSACCSAAWGLTHSANPLK